MTIQYASGPIVMMSLGQFQFGISTAAYQELERATEYRWPNQERFLQSEALQFVGPGGDTINLPGVIYPEFRGGTGQLDAMRALAAQGQPQTMIDGNGNIMGRWVIERVQEKGSVFAAAGVARKQEFTISLRKFGELGAGGGALGVLLGGVSLASGATSSPLAGLANLTTSAGSQAAGFAASLSGAMNQVTAMASQIGSTVNGVLGPISRAVGVANSLKSAATDAKRMLGSTATTLSGISSATSLVNAAASAVNNAGAAGAMLKRSVADLTSLGTVPDAAMQTVQGALVTVNRLTAMATNTQVEGAKLLGRLGR
jgi:phage protein U